MIYDFLGNTDIRVSKIALGALTIGPLQKKMNPREAAKVIRYALERGINFIDTADLYQTYPHIEKAIKDYPGEVIISTKSYDYTREGLKSSLDKALKELKKDTIDIYLLHEQESINTIRGHWDAFEYMIKEKEKGNIRSIGISTHRVEGVMGACKYNEIDIIHPIINIDGLGIEDGTRQDMEEAIKYAHSIGKGIYAMKIFGGGNLIHKTQECFDYIKSVEGINSFAIGMQNNYEIDYNIKQLLGEKIQPSLYEKLDRQKRELIIEEWCSLCGTCIEKCHQHALHMEDQRVKINKSKCLTCGYCGAYCPEFCIKIV